MKHTIRKLILTTNVIMLLALAGGCASGKTDIPKTSADTAAAADVSEESGRLGGNGRSGAADEPENGGADMAVGSDEAAAARHSEAGVTKASVEKAVEQVKKMRDALCVEL